jgi:hypothetical protein
VAHRGIVGRAPQNGPTATAAGQNGLPTLTVPQASNTRTWAEETDIRPTLLSLVGLRDDYLSDGTVLTGILARHRGDDQVDELAAAYKQLNSSVGAFATDTLKADTVALASSGAGDKTFTKVESALTRLADERDALAQQIKTTLARAQFGDGRVDRGTVRSQLVRAEHLLEQAHELSNS